MLDDTRLSEAPYNAVVEGGNYDSHTEDLIFKLIKLDIHDDIGKLIAGGERYVLFGRANEDFQSYDIVEPSDGLQILEKKISTYPGVILDGEDITALLEMPRSIIMSDGRIFLRDPFKRGVVDYIRRMDSFVLHAFNTFTDKEVWRNYMNTVPMNDN